MAAGIFDSIRKAVNASLESRVRDEGRTEAPYEVRFGVDEGR